MTHAAHEGPADPGRGAGPPPRWLGVLDWAAVLAGILFCAGMLVFRMALWRPVADLLPGSPERFVAAFSLLNERGDMVVYPLGVVTSILVVILLIREGGLATWRGGLRLAAIVALLAATLVRAAGSGPLEEAIAGSVAGLPDGDLTSLVRRWAGWQWASLSLALVVGVSLVAAHRAPRVAARESADGLTARHRSLMFLLGAVALFEGYDRFVVMLALPYIGRDLGAGEGGLGWALSAIRVGALVSVVLCRLADRHGRRRVLLGSVLASTLATGATALSTGLFDFIAWQLVATVFLVTELALAQVVIAEEFPAAQRGRGQGMLGAFAALGGGVVSLLFPLFEKTPLGWRGLYLVGLLPLVLLASLWRALPETEHWKRARRADAHVHVKLRELLRAPYRLRFLVLVSITFCLVAGSVAAAGFLSYRATRDLGWSPARLSTMILTGGGIGLAGWFVLGQVADALGRRLTGAVSFLLLAVAILAFYRTSQLIPALAGLVFADAGAQVALNSLGTELFPTRMRASAKAWLANAGIVGAMAGLGAVGALAERAGGVADVISVLAFLPALCAPAFYLLPETRSRKLEAIAADDD